MVQHLLSWSVGHRDAKPPGDIFVVDDDPDMRDILAAALAPEGFPVTLFEDGDSFLQAAGTQAPLCVFLDVIMPKRSGLEVLKEFRTRQHATPVFLISSCDDTSTIVEAIKNGAHDYISKPFDRLAPGRRVRDAVEIWSHQVQERAAPAPRSVDDGEWFLLSASERELLAMMRTMGAARDPGYH